jgi:heat shock protein HslJ
MTTVTLDKNLNFLLKMKYLDRPGAAWTFRGKFNWNADGNTIRLDTGAGNIQFRVGENMLFPTDRNTTQDSGGIADSRYLLTKDNYLLVQRHWKLTELNGTPVSTDGGNTRPVPFILFNGDDNRFSGNSGCNIFTGSFALQHINGISLSQVVSTQMACIHPDNESEFLKAIQIADNFNIVGGEVLVLNRARMAPLARFQAVDKE